MFWQKIMQKPWIYPSYVWLIQLIVAILVVIFFTNIIAPHHLTTPAFWSWDTGWYKHIVVHGYPVSGKPGDYQPAAFYPLYPMVIRGLQILTHLSFKPASFLVANACFLAALIVLYKFTLREHDETIAKHTLWLLTAFPTAMFYNCAYTESMNLLFLVLFFYCLQQGWWYRAMISGFFSAITHGTGLLLIIPAIVYLWCKRKEMDSKTLFIHVISLIIIPLGVVLYMIYLYSVFGTPFAFVYAHKYWHHKMTVPVVHIFTYLIHVYHTRASLESAFIIVQILNAACVLFMVAMGILLLTVYNQKFSWPLKVFYVVTLLVSVASGPGGHLDSFGRYVSVLFPGFIVWSYCTRKEAIFLLSLSITLPIKTILMGMFANAYWIT